MAIEVKSLFSGWHKVNKETAIELAKHILDGATCPNVDLDYINKNKIRGITITREDIDKIREKGKIK